MISVIGQITTDRGLVQRIDRAGTPQPYDLPAVGYYRDQAAGLPICFDHDRSFVVGEVGHLERSKASGLMMVGRLERDDLSDLLASGPWYLSDSVLCRHLGQMVYGQGRLQEVSLVRHTANINTRPICWSFGDIVTNTCARPGSLPIFWRDTWDRAKERMGSFGYQRSDRLLIDDIDPLSFWEEVRTDPVAALVRAQADLEAMPALKPARLPDMTGWDLVDAGLA